MAINGSVFLTCSLCPDQVFILPCFCLSSFISFLLGIFFSFDPLPPDVFVVLCHMYSHGSPLGTRCYPRGSQPLVCGALGNPWKVFPRVLEIPEIICPILRGWTCFSLHSGALDPPSHPYPDSQSVLDLKMIKSHSGAFAPD